MPNPNPNTIVILDTFYFLHRSFHAFPMELKNSKGEHTNVVFGFTQTLLDTIAEFNPTHIACSWESEELPSFRKELYPQYQMNRISMDAESEKIFSEQLPRVIEIINAFNIPRLTSNGFEGDDVIGTCAVLSSKEANVIIASSDQDILQLIDDRVSVFRPSRPPYVKKELFDKHKFKEKYGFDPIQMIDYKALRGDPSDNIPGVKGVGEKTAKELLAEFYSIEDIYQNLDKVKSESVRKKLDEGKSQAFLSKQLATIITNIPMEFDLVTCEVHDFDIEKARKIFEKYEFTSLLPKLKKLENIKNIKKLLKNDAEKKIIKVDPQLNLL